MEPISEILKRFQTNTSDKNTETWSNAKTPETPATLTCAICGGVRFVYPLLPSGKPDFSRVVPCKCVQKELDEGRQSRLQRYSNLGALTRLTFDNLLPHSKSENLAVQEQFTCAYQAAKAFAAKAEGWLVIIGPSGSGKTHLAAAIANHCIAGNNPVLYISVPDLLDHLRSSFKPDSEIPYDEFFELVRNTPLLILDDLGVQSGTPWAKEKLDQLLNHRFNNRLPTVIVSIVPVAQLDDRIQARLNDSNLCQIYEIGGGSQSSLVYCWPPGFELQKGMTFTSFDWKRVNLPREERDNLREAFRLASEFAQQPENWLVFQGVNGCGKTHLAAAIVNYRYQNKKPALFIVVPDFLHHLRSTFSPDSKVSYDELFEKVKNAPLLVLDDFGKQTTTPWAQEKLFQVINYRYNAQLPTVVTTNCSTDEMDNSISSRFIDGKVSTLFHVTVPQYYSGEYSRAPGKRETKK